MARIYAQAISAGGQVAKGQITSLQIGPKAYSQSRGQSSRTSSNQSDYWQYFALVNTYAAPQYINLISDVLHGVWAGLGFQVKENPPLQFDYDLFMRTYYDQTMHKLRNLCAQYGPDCWPRASIACLLFRGKLAYLSVCGGVGVLLRRTENLYWISGPQYRSEIGFDLSTGWREEENYRIDLEIGDELYLIDSGIISSLGLADIEAYLVTESALDRKLNELLLQPSLNQRLQNRAILGLRIEDLSEADELPEQYNLTYLEELEQTDLGIDLEFEAKAGAKTDFGLVPKLILIAFIVLLVIGLVFALWIIFQHFIAKQIFT